MSLQEVIVWSRRSRKDLASSLEMPLCFAAGFDVLAAAWGLGRPVVGQGYGWHTLQVLSEHFQTVGLCPLVGHKLNY